jgi:hypothetical protein
MSHEPLTTQLVADVLRDLLIAFPSRISSQNPAHTAEVYRNGLRGISGDALRAAADIHIKTGEFFPKVGKLRELAGEWSRRTRVDMPSRQAAWDACSICGARAELQTGERQMRDWNQKGALLWEGVDADGKPKPKMEPIAPHWVMTHNPIAHNVHKRDEATDVA